MPFTWLLLSRSKAILAFPLMLFTLSIMVVKEA